MTPLYVSFFTPAYAAEAFGLVESLDRFRLSHDVRPVPCRGSWLANCAQKPAFLLAMRDAHPGAPLVWVDADARVLKPPDLFDALDCDVAVHWRGGVELLSGTVYLGPGDDSGRLLSEWRAACNAEPGKFDQRHLQAILDGSHRYRVQFLPAAYCRILDADEMCPEADAVIWHGQASRLKRF